MLKIKLSVRGKKHQRTYRIIVAEARSKRDGKYTDLIGHWNSGINEFKIDKKKYQHWVEKGAQPTEGVRKLLKTMGDI